jgi:MOSC domain-containing protein YiiM
MPADMDPAHRTAAELAQGLAAIRESPRDGGRLEMIVRRPAAGARENVAQGLLDIRAGLLGDPWGERGGARSRDEPHPDTQITLMNARVIALIAPDRSRWPLAGDQLFVDLDLGRGNLPVGTQLEIGAAMIEVTAPPHTGCGKFVERFGVAATAFVNSPEGRHLCLRGIKARVIRSGPVSVGDRVVKRVPAPAP